MAEILEATPQVAYSVKVLADDGSTLEVNVAGPNEEHIAPNRHDSSYAAKAAFNSENAFLEALYQFLKGIY